MLNAFRSRLQYRLWLAFMMVLFIPIGIITYYHTTEFAGTLRETIRLSHEQLSTSRTTEVEATLRQATADLLFLGQSTELRRYINVEQRNPTPPDDAPNERGNGLGPPDIEAFFANFLTRSGETYQRVCLIDGSGMERTCVGMHNGLIRVLQADELRDQIDSDHFNGAISLTGIGASQPLVYVSDVQLHQEASGTQQPYEPVLIYATRLQTDDGMIAGVLALEMRVEPLLALLQSTEPDEITLVVDYNGDYLLHPDPDQRFGSLLGTGASLFIDCPHDATPLLSQNRGVWFGSTDQPDDLVAFARVAPRAQRTRWTVIYQRPLSEVMAPVREAQQVTLLVSGVLFLLTSALSLLLAHRITAPLDRLTRTATALLREEWDTPIATNDSPGELGKLTRAFSQMRDNIRALIESLQTRIEELETLQTALQHNEQKYRNFVEQADEGIRLVDGEGIILEWNAGCERITGIPAAEAIGHPLAEIQARLEPTHARAGTDIDRQLRNSLSRIYPVNDPNMSPLHLPTQPIHRLSDGTLRYVDNVIFPIRTSSEVYFGNIIRDVTEQRTNTERIAQQLRHLAAFQAIAIAVGGAFRLDEVLDIILDQLQQLIPYDSASVFLGQADDLRIAKSRGFAPDHDFITVEAMFHDESHWQAKYNLDTGEATVITDVTQNSAWVTTPSSDVRIRSWLGVPLIHRGVVLGVMNLDHHAANAFTEQHAQIAYAIAKQASIAVITAQMVENLGGIVRERTTELRLEKERSEAILNHVTDAIVFTDTHANVIFVNQAWEALNGYSLLEVIGQSTRILQSGETPAETYQAMWQSLQAGLVWRGDVTNKRKDGRLYRAELTIAPVYNERHIVENYVGVLRDVTKRRELEALKEQFIANAAHDLGNPVQVLTTTLALIKVAPEEFERRLPVLEYQMLRLSSLVSDLLTISRLDRGLTIGTARPLRFDNIVRMAVDAQQPLAQERGIALTHEIELVPPLLGEATELERVVVNLIANALNYTPRGGRVAVTVQVNHNGLLFRVADTGIGIAPHEQPRVFERFYRSDTARATADGTGLGLSIVKAIVEKYGGNIDLESILGEGTIFTVHLPYPNMTG